MVQDKKQGECGMILNADTYDLEAYFTMLKGRFESLPVG